MANKMEYKRGQKIVSANTFSVIAGNGKEAQTDEKMSNQDENQSGSRDSLSKYMYQIWRICLDLCAHESREWIWLTFGCKVGQSDPIAMKIKLYEVAHTHTYMPTLKTDI